MTGRQTTLRLAAITIFAAAAAISTLACALTSAGQGGSQPVYDSGDKLKTTVKEKLTIGGPTGKGQIDTYFDADNWTFEGSAGQTVTITVASVGESDPHFKLLDPSGAVLGEDDDAGGGSNAQLQLALPASGTYTIRIDMMATGEYTVSVK